MVFIFVVLMTFHQKLYIIATTLVFNYIMLHTAIGAVTEVSNLYLLLDTIITM